MSRITTALALVLLLSLGGCSAAAWGETVDKSVRVLGTTGTAVATGGNPLFVAAGWAFFEWLGELLGFELSGTEGIRLAKKVETDSLTGDRTIVNSDPEDKPMELDLTSILLLAGLYIIGREFLAIKKHDQDQEKRLKEHDDRLRELEKK